MDNAKYKMYRQYSVFMMPFLWFSPVGFHRNDVEMYQVCTTMQGGISLKIKHFYSHIFVYYNFKRLLQGIKATGP